jgi:uncharacterized protein YjiK
MMRKQNIFHHYYPVKFLQRGRNPFGAFISPLYARRGAGGCKFRVQPQNEAKFRSKEFLPFSWITILSFLFLLLFCACTQSSNHKKKKHAAGAQVMLGKYDLTAYEKIVLPQQLDEISGIAFDSTGTQFAAVNDEEGKLFFLDPATGEIKNKIKFGDKGDYEELFYARGCWYVLRSDGALARIDANLKGDSVVQWTELSTDIGLEFEAAWYNSGNKKIWQACKKCSTEKPDIAAYYTNEKGFYEVEKAEINFSSVDNKKGNLRFHASGAAVNPDDSLVYMISSPDKKILRMTGDGVAKDLISLDPSVFKQPEGICFGPGGTMYISNEAAGGNASLLIFKPQN